MSLVTFTLDLIVIHTFFAGILPLVTPKQLQHLIHVPTEVRVPEVCCVWLSQQTTFPIQNILDRGVKCTLEVRGVKVRHKGKLIQVNSCPFDVKRQVILEPDSSQSIQVSIYRLVFSNHRHDNTYYNNSYDNTSPSNAKMGTINNRRK